MVKELVGQLRVKPNGEPWCVYNVYRDVDVFDIQVWI